MRRALTLFLLAMGCSRAEPPAARPAADLREPSSRPPVPPAVPGEPMALVPGRFLGPVVLGMSVRELSGLGTLTEHARRSEKVTYSLLPWQVSVTARGGGVDRLSVNVTDYAPGLRIGATLVRSTTPLEAVLAALSGCGATEIQLGGTITTCEGGRVTVRQEGPARALVIEMSMP